MSTYVQTLKTYMTALGEGDYATIKGLFAPDGRVQSPLVGELPAVEFFDRLDGATSNNVITPIDVFSSDSDQHQAVAYFKYDWTVKDGSLISFKVMDLFTFTPDSERIQLLSIIYDTHPIRVAAEDALS